MVDAAVIDAAGRARVSAAIEAAESATAGEIYVVVARQSGQYAWTSLVWGGVLALLAPLAILMAGLDPIELARLFLGGWQVGHDVDVAGDAASGMAITVAIQAAVFAGVSALGLVAPLREIMTPAFLKRHSVHRAALDQFLGHGIHLTADRTGVLIYVSLAEHQAEIVADSAIYQKVGPDVWSGAVASLLRHAKAGDLAGGLTEAVQACGAVLATHFPPRPDDSNELPNAVVLI